MREQGQELRKSASYGYKADGIWTHQYGAPLGSRDERDKGHTPDEWLIGMMRLEGKGVIRTFSGKILQWTAERDPQNSLKV